jgi:hypothetical protein
VEGSGDSEGTSEFCLHQCGVTSTLPVKSRTMAILNPPKAPSGLKPNHGALGCKEGYSRNGCFVNCFVHAIRSVNPHEGYAHEYHHLHRRRRGDRPRDLVVFRVALTRRSSARVRRVAVKRVDLGDYPTRCVIRSTAATDYHSAPLPRD